MFQKSYKSESIDAAPALDTFSVCFREKRQIHAEEYISPTPFLVDLGIRSSRAIGNYELWW